MLKHTGFCKLLMKLQNSRNYKKNLIRERRDGNWQVKTEKPKCLEPEKPKYLET